MNEPRLRPGPLLAAAMLLGAGLGGFVDTIFMHQLLGWHTLLAGVTPPPDPAAQRLAEGLYAAFHFLLVVSGLALLWGASRRDDAAWSGRLLVGGAFMGWAVFNLLEGVASHHLLGLHHVRMGASALAYDLAFLAGSVVLLALGWAIARERARVPARPRRVPGFRERHA